MAHSLSISCGSTHWSIWFVCARDAHSWRREQLIRWWEQLIQQREQLIREKVVGLSEKSYHFWKSRTTFRREQLIRNCIQLSRNWLQLIRNWLRLSRRCISLSPAHNNVRARVHRARELFEKYLSPSPILAQMPCTKAFQPIRIPNLLSHIFHLSFTTSGWRLGEGSVKAMWNVRNPPYPLETPANRIFTGTFSLNGEGEG